MLKAFYQQYRHSLLLATSAFVAGILLTVIAYIPMQKALSDLQGQQQQHVAQRQELLQRTAACEIDNQVMHNSKKALQRLVEEQQQEIDEHNKNLQFYRQLMQAEPSKEGLDLNASSIIPLAGGQYLYRFTFVQYARKHALLNLSLQIELHGIQQGKEIAYPLTDLLVEGVEPVERLRFKYFQVVEGKLILPQGFQPDTIVIRAISAKRGVAPWQQQLAWQIQEP